MSFEKTAFKAFGQPLEKVYEAATSSIKPMGGKILKKDPDCKYFHAQMDKKLYGKVLGDRSMLEVTFNSETESSTRMDVLAYPLNAVGQKLLFGVRPGVVETVLAAFLVEVENHLAENPDTK
jgi:hypothetical protein